MTENAGAERDARGALPAFLRQGGETGRLIAAHDWASTPLGPLADWSEGLKAIVATLLSADLPMALLFGERGILVYNDGYAEICGGRHPAALGSSAMDIWPEAADFNANVVKVVLGGERLSYSDMHLVLMRNGAPEDTWFDLNYSPVWGPDGKPFAVLAVVAETTARHAAEEDLDQRRQRFSHALNGAGVIGIWDWDRDSGLMFADARFADFFSVDAARAENGVPRAEFDAAIHPDDRGYVEEQTAEAIATGSDLAIEHRLLHKDGSVRWVMIRGSCLLDRSGVPSRLSGAAVEITSRKHAEESRRLLIRELHHRIKNTFAVIAGMVTMTARSAADVNEMADVLRGRLVALAAAHELIRPAITAEVDQTERTTLSDLFTAILTPHLYFPEQFSIDAPVVDIGVTAATSLALVLHELATNAAKYGALSTVKGRLAVTAHLTDTTLDLEWTESDGPAVSGPPRHHGFGSRLATMSIVGQLAGSISFDWNEAGLVARLVMSRDRLAR